MKSYKMEEVLDELIKDPKVEYIKLLVAGKGQKPFDTISVKGSIPAILNSEKGKIYKGKVFNCLKELMEEFVNSGIFNTLEYTGNGYKKCDFIRGICFKYLKEGSIRYYEI